MPMKTRMSGPSLSGTGGAAARAPLVDHLEIALEPVLDVGRREIARIDEIAFDERARFAGAALNLAQDQELTGGETVATLDRIDHQPVGLILMHIFLDEIDPRGQIAVGVAAEAIFREAFERACGVVTKAEIIEAADFAIGAGDDDGTFLVEHFPEIAEAGPVRRSFYHQPIALFRKLARRRHRSLPARQTFGDFGPQQTIIFNRVLGAAKCRKNRPDVIDAAEISVDRRGLGLGRFQDPDQILFGARGTGEILAQPIDIELDAADPFELRDHLFLELL